MKHLQAGLQKFDLIAIPNKKIIIRYFWEDLKPSIWVQLNAQDRYLKSWKEAIEKAVNAEAKTLLQSSSNTRKIDSKCPQKSKPDKKEEKDSKKIKFADSPSANIPYGYSTHQSQINKKNQDHQQWFWRRGEWGQAYDSSATGANANAVKKDKRNISQVECFTCH